MGDGVFIYDGTPQNDLFVTGVLYHMKILYDHQIFSYERCGGISRYFTQLMKHYQHSPACSFEISLKYSDNLFLEDTPTINVRSFFNNVHFKKKPGVINLLNINTSKRYLKAQNFDIFHPTFYNPYFLEHIGNKPFVLTVHDMITELLPNMYPGQKTVSDWKISLIRKADKIITPSENSRNDIIRMCDIDTEKVEVVYLGSSLHSDFSKKDHTSKLPQKYLLFVGKRPLYKNFFRFIRAVSYLLIMDKDLNLICAGSTKFTKEEKNLFKELKVSDKIFHYPTNDRFLVSLYQNALAFVLPSLYEGFGIQIVEAFSCGCPAIVSKTGALPEIGGKAVIYFDPEDESSIQKAVKKVVYDKSLRNILRQEGFERIRKFTWEQTALNTMKIYKSIRS